MKILALIITLWLSVITIPAFSEDGKTIDIKEMVKMAQAMKANSSLINDPEAMAALKRLVENFEKNPEIKGLMHNPEGLAAMIRIAGSLNKS